MTIGFRFPSDPGRVVERNLVVEVTRARGGGSAVRADGFAEWLPAHPRWDRIPKRAQVLTARVTVYGFRVHRHSESETFTAGQEVRRVVRAINRVGAMAPRRLLPCRPMFVSQTLRLSFRARVGGPVLARATSALGCGAGLVVNVRGRRGPVLWLPDAAWKVLAQVERRHHRHAT